MLHGFQLKLAKLLVSSTESMVQTIINGIKRATQTSKRGPGNMANRADFALLTLSTLYLKYHPKP